MTSAALILSLAFAMQVAPAPAPGAIRADVRPLPVPQATVALPAGTYTLPAGTITYGVDSITIRLGLTPGPGPTPDPGPEPPPPGPTPGPTPAPDFRPIAGKIGAVLVLPSKAGVLTPTLAALKDDDRLKAAMSAAGVAFVVHYDNDSYSTGNAWIAAAVRNQAAPCLVAWPAGGDVALTRAIPAATAEAAIKAIDHARAGTKP